MGQLDLGTLLGGRLPTFLTPNPAVSIDTVSDISALLGPDVVKTGRRHEARFRFENRPVSGAKAVKLKQKFEKSFTEDAVDKIAKRYVLTLAGDISKIVGQDPPKPSSIKEIDKVKGFTGGVRAAFGSIFDAAITTGLGLQSKKADAGDFDYRQKTEGKLNPRTGALVGSPVGAHKWMEDIFGPNFAPKGGLFSGLADMKFGGGQSTRDSMVAKTKTEMLGRGRSQFQQRKDKMRKFFGYGPIAAAGGYIPNFDATRGYGALEDSIAREQAAGLPINQIRVNQDGRLRNSGNPMGLAVTNVRDEPVGSIAAGGYVPNYTVAFSPLGAGIHGKQRAPAGAPSSSPPKGGDPMGRLLGLSIALSMLQGQINSTGGEMSGMQKGLSGLTTSIMLVATVSMLNLKKGFVTVGQALQGFALRLKATGRMGFWSREQGAWWAGERCCCW